MLSWLHLLPTIHHTRYYRLSASNREHGRPKDDLETIKAVSEVIMVPFVPIKKSDDFALERGVVTFVLLPILLNIYLQVLQIYVYSLFM